MEEFIVKQGLVLMVAGMVIVFVFLYLMVCLMRLMAIVVPRFNHILPDVAPKAAARPAAPTTTKDDAAIAVAIAVAFDRSS